MYIQKISFTPVKFNVENYNKPNIKNKLLNSQIYNPIAYQDFNITFGDRLFRTPSNFFAQDFNRNNMPETMKSYLFANYEDRQNIPPAQMMKIVFNDINSAESLEEVKEFYPNEPLFSNLQSMKNKKYRQGILAEINLMKEPDKSLFKNGKDDLGMYILKKIYLEGKTLKEINKDFKKDVSVYYNGLSDISYNDLANFGIKYPNNSFWHSFIVTREDFPYVQVKRKDSQYHASDKVRELTLSDINKGNFQDKKLPKFKPKEYEIRDITSALTEDFGDVEKTKRNLKRKFRSDDPKLTFIQQYMSEIMTISLDRVHASEEMSDFFENYDNIDNSTRTKLKKYWDSTPEMKALQGLIMSDTIKYFFLTYGADGNNEEFRDLINYAHSIKPNREKDKIKHDIKQKEYEEIFKDYNPNQPLNADLEEEILSNLVDITDDIPQEDDYIHSYHIGNHNVLLEKSLDDMLTDYFNERMNGILPKAYISKYVKTLKEHPKSNNNLLLSIILQDTQNNASDDLISVLYPVNEAINELHNINVDFMRHNLYETRAAQQAMITALAKLNNQDITLNDILSFYYIYPLSYSMVFRNLNMNLKIPESELHNNYKAYLKPLTQSEAQKISIKAVELLKKYDIRKSLYYGKPEYKEDIDKMEIIKTFFDIPKNSGHKVFREFILLNLQKFYGGSARAIIDPKFPENLKFPLMEDILLSIISNSDEMLNKIKLLTDLYSKKLDFS